jgi:hypothetical protein
MATNLLSKTRRRVTDISGEFAGLMNDRADKFMAFLSTNADNAFTRPWHRLEHGLRINRIRKYVADESQQHNFSESDQQKMFDTLSKALLKKQLNSKSVVIYDTEKQSILEIKGFSYHKVADGSLQFQFSERKTGTLRRKLQGPQQQPQQQQQQQEPQPQQQPQP